MRSTVVEHVECRRLVPYERDDHSILIREGNLDFNVVTLRDGILEVRFTFKNQFRSRDSKVLWGIVEVEGLTRIESPDVKAASFDTPGGAPIPDGLRFLLEGALADEILLPLSQVVRAMHLPSLVVSPVGLQEVVIGRRETIPGAGQPSLKPRQKGSTVVMTKTRRTR